MNSIAIIGRLTADPELKTTPSGNFVCSFDVAVKRPYSSDKTDFLKCVSWKSTAEFIAKHFSKGKMIALCGYLSNRSYDDKNGVKHTVAEIVVNDVEFCGDKKQNESTENPKVNFEEIKANEELPF